MGAAPWRRGEIRLGGDHCSQYRHFGGPCGTTLPPEVLLHDQRPGIAQAGITTPPVKLRIWHSIAAGPCLSERAVFARSCRRLGAARANPKPRFGCKWPAPKRNRMCRLLACRSFLGRSSSPPRQPPRSGFVCGRWLHCGSLSTPAPLSDVGAMAKSTFPQIA